MNLWGRDEDPDVRAFITKKVGNNFPILTYNFTTDHMFLKPFKQKQNPL